MADAVVVRDDGVVEAGAEEDEYDGWLHLSHIVWRNTGPKDTLQIDNSAGITQFKRVASATVDVEIDCGGCWLHGFYIRTLPQGTSLEFHQIQGEGNG